MVTPIEDEQGASRFLLYFAGPLTGAVVYLLLVSYFHVKSTEDNVRGDLAAAISNSIEQGSAIASEPSPWLYSLPIALAVTFIVSICFIGLGVLLKNRSTGEHQSVPTQEGVQRLG